MHICSIIKHILLAPLLRILFKALILESLIVETQPQPKLKCSRVLQCVDVMCVCVDETEL